MSSNQNVGPTIFKAVEEAIFYAVRKNGNSYWVNLQAARLLIGDSYSDQGLQTHKAAYLPYAFEALRLAYAYLAFTAHAHMVKEFLGRFWTSKAAFRMWFSHLKDGQLRVCCIGGGPGSDILGLFLFFLKQKMYVPNFRADVLELWSEWEETFKTLLKHIYWEFDRPTGEITTDYWHFDFNKIWDTKYQLSQQITRLREANLVTMVKFVSSVAADKYLCKKKLIILLNFMKEGALILFINNAGGGYAAIANQAASYAGFRLIGQFEHEDFSLPEHEAAAISSSKLIMVKTKPDKTWKISASLWQKGP